MKKVLSLLLAFVLAAGSMGSIALAAEEDNVVAYFPLYGDHQFEDSLHEGVALTPPSDGNAIVGDSYLSLHRNESAGNPDNTGHLVSDYPGEKITGDQISFSFNVKVDANQTRTPSAEEAALRTIFLFGSSDYSKNCITLRYYYPENTSAVVLVQNGQDAVVASFERPLADMWHNYAISLDGGSGGKLTVYVDGAKVAEVDSNGIGADEIGSDVVRLNRATSSTTINVDSCYRDLRFIKGIITAQQIETYNGDIEALTWESLQEQTFVTEGMRVRDDIDLPLSSSITWLSSDEAAINPATGAVTRPEYGQGEKAVTLTLCWKAYSKQYTVYLLPMDAGDSVVTTFDFDSLEVGSKIDHIGEAKYSSSMAGYGQAADITGDFYMQVNAENGSSLLANASAVTVSYDSKTTVPADGNGEIVCVSNSLTGGKIAVTDLGETVKISAGGVEFEAAASGNWKKVIASFSDSALRLYIDGTLVVEETGAFNVSSALGEGSVFTLGMGGAGLVDNVYIFNRDLTVEEINEYFVANVAPVMSVSGGSETYPNDIFEPVSITHPAGSGVIYYTLDSTEPTTESIKYTGAFYADGNAHIIACAISSSGVKSGTVEAYVYNKAWAATAAEFRIEGENTVNNAKIGWPLYPNATSYEVYRGDVLVGTATGDGLEDYDLEINKNYTYTVKALNGSDVIAVADTNTIMTFAVNLDDITGYDDNVNGGWVPLIESEPSPSGFNINGKYYSVSLRGVSRDDFVAAGFDGEIWDSTCSVTSICYKESDDGLTWPEEWTMVYPIFVDMRLEGSHSDLHTDGETIIFSAHAEGTSGYGAAKLFFAAFKPGRSGDNIAPYGITVSGGKLLETSDPWEQYELIDSPAKNQVSSYYIGRPFGYDSRDMVRFIDDGNFYTFSATAMNQDMLILKLDDNWTKPEKVMNVILKGQRQESPSVFHDGNAFYIYTSTANGWFSSQARYASSSALDEPWSPLREIANSGTFATQANGVWGYSSDSGRVVQRGHGYNWGQSGGWRTNNYQRYWHMAINNGVATGAWCSKMEYHPYWGAIAVQSGQLVSLGKKATAEGKDAPYLTDNTQLQSSEVTEIQNLPYDIIVDLEQPTVITEVNLTNDLYIGSTCGSCFYVYGSNDNSNWTLLADETGDSDDDPAFRNSWIEDTTPYRYIKVTVTAVKNLQNGGASALWGGKPLEVAIYGKPVGYVDEIYEFTDDILVGYDRKNIDFEAYSQEPVIVEGRVLVPLRAIFEAMGAEVLWDDSTKTVTASRGDTTISLAIDSDQLYVNGVPTTIDVPAQLINGRTMVPVRAIAESFNCDVDWNDGARRVYIEEAD